MSPYIYLPLLFLIENQNVPVRRDYSIIKSDNNLQVYRRMLVEGPIRLHKLIKVYKIEGEFKDIKQKSSMIMQKLADNVRWSSIQKCDVQEHYLLFPNESIYNQGVHISYLSQKQCYSMELIKSKAKNTLNDCFGYQYQQCTFYDDPIPMLKSLGYNHLKRKSKNVTIFKSLKLGVEIILYHLNDKDENAEETKKGKLEVVESGAYQFHQRNLMIHEIEKLLKGLIVLPLQNELHHELMTLSNLGVIQFYN